MHSHNVFFWLKEALSDTDLLEFEKGLDSLTMTRLVISGYYGKPANTNRDVVENTYTYGFSLLFKDTADHNLYQADPVHLAFVQKHSAKWARVRVFDVEIKKTRQVIGIASLVNALNPELVIFGGILSLAGEFLMTVVEKEVDQRALKWNRRAMQLVLAKHGSDACVMGGVATVYQAILA